VIAKAPGRKFAPCPEAIKKMIIEAANLLFVYQNYIVQLGEIHNCDARRPIAE
jgi:hypothetical protein